jgi:hypothetical protein
LKTVPGDSLQKKTAPQKQNNNMPLFDHNFILTKNQIDSFRKNLISHHDLPLVIIESSQATTPSRALGNRVACGDPIQRPGGVSSSNSNAAPAAPYQAQQNLVHDRGA